MNQWQPIETYPVKLWKTGPRVLLWSENDGIVIGDGRLVQEGENPNDLDMVFYDEYTWPADPSHWMPLPPAPQGAKHDAA